MRKIVIVGIGYVGFSMAVLLSKHNTVKLVDVSSDKVEKINSGKLPIIDQEIEKYFSNIKLNFDATIDGEADYRDAEFVIISTSTNYDETKRCFDTSSVECVIQQIISVNPDGVKAFLLYHNAT